MKELSTGASCNRDAEKLAKEIEKALAKKGNQNNESKRCY